MDIIEPQEWTSRAFSLQRSGDGALAHGPLTVLETAARPTTTLSCGAALHRDDESVSFWVGALLQQTSSKGCQLQNGEGIPAVLAECSQTTGAGEPRERLAAPL